MDNNGLFHDVYMDETHIARYSVIGYKYNNNIALRTYVLGYRKALDILVAQYTKIDYRDCGSLDEIVYPIVFISRHIVELYLKSLGLKYCKKNKQKNLKVITSSHNLNELYDEIENELVILCKKGGLNLNSSFIRSYLDQIELYDAESYCFRYPFDTDENSNFKKQIAIDVEDFYKKINYLFDYLEEIYKSIDNVIDNDTYDKSLANYLYYHCLEQKENVKELINLLSSEACDKKDNEDTSSVIDYADISLQGNDEKERRAYIKRKNSEDLKFINLLLFTGRDLSLGAWRLSESDTKKDFCKVLIDNYLGSDFIKNNQINNGSFNPNYKILETRADLLIEWLEESIQVLIKIENTD